MGGIPTNIHGEVLTLNDSGSSKIVKGLMSVGEAACVSVHGANRLGSNSLLDLVVFGKSLAKRCAKILNPKKNNPIIEESFYEPIIRRFNELKKLSGKFKISDIRLEMRHVMQNYCPVYRSEEKMIIGKQKLLILLDKFKKISIKDKTNIWNTEIVEAFELENLLLQSLASIESALNRKESRGAHSRVDYKKRNDKNWLKHTMAWVNNKNKPKIRYRSVNLKTNSKEIKLLNKKQEFINL